MANDRQETEVDYDIKFREDEELEFFMELAIHETERWIQAVTKKSFSYPDDTRKSLENGVLLCELLNGLQPGTIKRINKLPTPIAGLDNINVFLKACKNKFRLKDVHLFNPSDLEDLSQRAIADSEHLKDEYDKRLRNVAITIYWLGKYASQNLKSPQLDLSAYSALIHHRHEVEIGDRDFHQERSSKANSSWEWTRTGRTGSSPQYGGVAGGDQFLYQHTRESSFDSYEKESVDSLEGVSSEGSMPLYRYSSTSTLSKSRDYNPFHTGAGGDSGALSEEKHGGALYRSTPDLAQGGAAHRRYSSTDSMDGSHNSGQSSHSRQGSDSQETAYPTRRLGNQTLRKQSSSTDPLQFIKAKAAHDLAHTAEVQIRVAAESKKGVTVVRNKEEDADWQDNLSTWKSRRKSQSERTYHLQKDLEEMEKETGGEHLSTSQPKTYSQMQEDRERRRSVSKKFYPIEDEDNDNDDAFAPSVSKPLGRSAAEVSTTKTDIPSWTRDSDKEVQKNDQNSTASSKTDQNDRNNNQNIKIKSEEEIEETSRLSSAFRSKLSQKLRSFDEDETDSMSKVRSGAADRQSRRFDNSKSEDGGDPTIDHSVKRSGHILSKSADFSKKEDILSRDKNFSQRTLEPVNRRNDSFNKTKDMFNKSEHASDRETTGSTLITTRNVGSRNQSKIGSIMKNFEDSASKPTLPKQGYNEKIDLTARKHTFENVNTSQNNFRSNGATVNRSAPSGSRFWHKKDEESEEEEEESFTTINNNYGKTSVTAAPPPPVSAPPSVPSPFSSSSEAAPPLPASSRPQMVTPANAAVAGDSNKISVKKLIKISQKPNNDKGFGFILTGGADKNAPVSVGRVVLGSAADICDLMVKDIVLSVNQIDVTTMTTAEVGDIVAKAVSVGYIEMQIKREEDEDDLEDEEFDSSSDEGEQDISSPGYKAPHVQEAEVSSGQMVESKPGTSSVMNQLAAEREWLERQIKAGEDSRKDEVPSFQIAEFSNRLDVETKSMVTLNKPNSETDTALLSPASVEIKHSPNSSMDDSDGGPPAILRKWQRQRQKEEYTFDTGSDVTDSFKKISLNTRLPRRESDANEDTTDSKMLSGGFARAWDDRMDGWTRKQDQERQHDTSTEENTQANFAADQARIKALYEQDLQRAEERNEEKARQEVEMLKPELDHARVLEERRAERRARIQQNAAAASTSSEDTQKTAVFFTVTSQQQRQSETTPVLYSKHVTSIAPAGSFVIDPRNRQGDNEGPVEFQVKLEGSQPTFDLNTVALLEAERERIRQEELKKIEEEKQKIEAERRAREEEEMRRLQEKEKELKQGEERLRMDREKLLREQEEFRRQKELQQQQDWQRQQRQQQEQQMLQTYSIPVQHQHSSSLDQNRLSPAPGQRDQSPGGYAPVHFQPQRSEPQPTSKEDYPHYQNTSTISDYQQQSNQPHSLVGQSEWQAASSQRAPVPTWQSGSKVSQSGQSHSEPARGGQVGQPERNEWQPVPSQRTSVPTWQSGSNNQQGGQSNAELARGGHRFSRDEMLAMNRKATPKDDLSTVEQVTTNEESLPSPGITREAPSRDEIHSLNFVPKAKLRNDRDWYTSQMANVANLPQSESTKYKPPWQEGRDRKTGRISLAGPGDHWLVEEAERRRIAESEGRTGKSSHGSSAAIISGPIKPSGNSSNRWRDNNGYASELGHGRDGRSVSTGSMPAAIRQTLLQKTAGARGSNDLIPSSQSSSSGSRSSPLSSSFHNQDSYHTDSVSPHDQIYHQHHHHQQQPQYSSAPISSQPKLAPPTGHGVPPTSENGISVNGPQLCSYCHQEFSSGPAMVIESLGLYFHVKCFRCCVCHASLGTGSQGADVRVRANKLHCPDCYSNDEAGLKFSKV